MANDQVQSASSPVALYEQSFDVLDLAGLERAKIAAGRVKDIADLAFIAELKKRT